MALSPPSPKPPDGNLPITILTSNSLQEDLNRSSANSIASSSNSIPQSPIPNPSFSNQLEIPNLALNDSEVNPKSNPLNDISIPQIHDSNPNSIVQNSKLGQEQEQKHSWASMVGSKGVGRTKLRFIPPTVVNGEAVVHLESRMFGKIQKRNEDLVIGSFISKRYSFAFVFDIIKRTWKPKHPITMKLYGKKSFSFEFANDDDKAQALEMGNLYIASQPFIVRPWKLFIEADLKNIDTLPIWAIFKEIPEELRDEDGYSRLASAIGTPLYTDRKTELKGGADARICIDIKASSKFPIMVPVVVDKVKVFKVAVTYNWKPPRCIHCQIFGHDENNCPKHRLVKPTTVWVPKEKPSTNAEIVQIEQGQGVNLRRGDHDAANVVVADLAKRKEAWHVVQPRNNNRNKRKDNNQQRNNVSSGTNMYVALENEEEDLLEDEDIQQEQNLDNATDNGNAVSANDGATTDGVSLAFPVQEEPPDPNEQVLIEALNEGVSDHNVVVESTAIDPGEEAVGSLVPETQETHVIGSQSQDRKSAEKARVVKESNVVLAMIAARVNSEIHSWADDIDDEEEEYEEVPEDYDRLGAFPSQSHPRRSGRSRSRSRKLEQYVTK